MNLNDNHTTLSRATSRTSHRSRNSTLSRNQSLIKKNIELIDLKPADVLIERFVAWKVIVKQLTSYFEGIADIENNTAKELTKLAGVIQVPFKAGNQFLGEGGLQDVYYNIRDKTRIIADQHADLGRTIDSSIVQHLQKLRAEVKAHIKNVQNDTGKLAASVAKERELSTKLVGELANNISTFKNTPMHLHAKNDPFISNQAVARQLQRQVLEENLLQKSIVMMQQNSAHFEEGIVKSIQSAWQTFDEWQSRASAASQEVFRSLTAHLSSLAPDREWIQFAARSDHLLDPDTPLRDPELITYPLKDDASVVPVHKGHLERKKRFTRAYTESYFVLTPAGFLHEYSTSDPTVSGGQHPIFSLFLPSCTLGPASSPTAKSHKFHIEGRKDGLGTTKSGSFKALLPGSEGTKAWSFRSRSRDDMMEWWNDIRMLCARYLVASEQIDRTGPVEAAVKSAGYNSEEYDEEEEEEEEGVQTADDGGSSVEEEVDHEPFEDSAPPDYTHPEKHYPVEIGPNGYAIEKKHPMPGHYPSNNNLNANTNANARVSNGIVNYHAQPTHPDFHSAPTTVHPGTHRQPHSFQTHPIVDDSDAPPPISPSAQYTGQATPNVDPGQNDDGTASLTGGRGGARVGRRLSRRQMEKAPEGRSARAVEDDAAAGAGVVDDDSSDEELHRSYVQPPRKASRSPLQQQPPARYTIPPTPAPADVSTQTHALEPSLASLPVVDSLSPAPATNMNSRDFADEEDAAEDTDDMYADEVDGEGVDHPFDEKNAANTPVDVHNKHNVDNHLVKEAEEEEKTPDSASKKGGFMDSVARRLGVS